MAANAGISFDAAAWAKVVNRYRNAAEKVGLVQRGLVRWAQQEAVREAQHQLDQLVYGTEARSGNVYRRGRFFGVLGSVRTGNTRRAVTKGAISWVSGQAAWGAVKVDRGVANRAGFYYPAILNRGRTDIRYYPRPFWTATVALMQVRYQGRGREALRQLHQQLQVG